MTVALSNPRILRPAAGAAAWLLLGLSGVIGAGWGYGLFFTSVLLLAGAAIAFGFLILTRAFDTGMLRGSAAWLGLIGVWVYVWAFAALAGHYSHETFAGRMELRWILFGPAVLAALVVLDVGLYRMLVGKNLPAWRRYRGVIRRELANPRAMRRTLVDDVVLHSTLFSVSGFRWLKHTLIFWGFGLMFAAELLAVVVREGFPAFGWTGHLGDDVAPGTARVRLRLRLHGVDGAGGLRAGDRVAHRRCRGRRSRSSPIPRPRCSCSWWC